MRVRRLLPDPAEVELDTVVGALELGPPAPRRPYLAANFAVTADGRATVGGRSGPIGDEVDGALFHLLRTRCDAVLIGAGTFRTERYGRLVKDPEARAARERAGFQADPLAVVVSGALDLPADAPLLGDPASRVVVYTAAAGDLAGPAAAVEVVRLRGGTLLLADVLHDLRTRLGVRSVLCEGGPHLFAGLLREGLADELFLTLAPRLVGGDEEARMLAGPALPAPATASLKHVLEHDGSLFLRYALG